MDTPSAGPRALAEAAKAGPYFTIQAWSAGAGWQPLRALLSDPAVLAARVGHTRRGLARHAGCATAAVEPRVAASVLYLGLAAQLVSPLLGAAVLAGVVPRLTAADLYWKPAPGGPWPLAARPVDGMRCHGLTAQQTAGQLADRIQHLTGPLASTIQLAFQLSGQVLRGNTASALAGASATLAATFPAQAGRATELAAGILAREPLRGSGEFGPDGRFLRRSCCLLYRVPGAGMCGDCLLAAR
ncbi:MAG TPA: (2Fe-2S)-binding protein [Streptosporangiaceae bacterium]|nr:(2Fe-2S)-binding protein [Streptosporangiaceae bacterium]